jgi:hypothetical protein
LTIYKELKKKETDELNSHFKVSNIICYRDTRTKCVIKAETNGEVIIKSGDQTKFENLFLPRKLKAGVLVVDLPLQVPFFPNNKSDSGLATTLEISFAWNTTTRTATKSQYRCPIVRIPNNCATSLISTGSSL